MLLCGPHLRPARERGMARIHRPLGGRDRLENGLGALLATEPAEGDGGGGGEMFLFGLKFVLTLALRHTASMPQIAPLFADRDGQLPEQFLDRRPAAAAPVS